MLRAAFGAVALAFAACASPASATIGTPAPAQPAATPPGPPASPAPPAVVSATPTQDATPLAGPSGGELPPIPPNTVVLHIGDSFALAGFAQALKPRMKALGARYEVRAETSSFTTTWSGRIEALIANTQPDLVIINLGANEVANVDPPAHAPAVRHIIAAIHGRPCVWISPPSWRKDTGIQDVIRQNSAPCRYFDSDKLVATPIPRQSDHIHPTQEGGAIWADAFWTWLQGERAPADPTAAKDAHRSPWLLKPSPKDEHEPAVR